jgi:uncharacterized protein YraI
VLAVAGSLAAAQTLDPPAASTVRVANTDGAELNLRAGPSTDDVVVARLAEGVLLSVTGSTRTGDGVRWLPVKDPSDHNGWVDAQYVALVSLPAASPTATATATPAPVPTETPIVESSGFAAVLTPTPILRPLEVEARLKFPETSGRDQEIMILVTRAGMPVPGAVVTVLTDEGEPPFDRPMPPTDDDGRTQHAFDIRHEKGTVSLVVKATAPDGSEGVAEASYFRR